MTMTLEPLIDVIACDLRNSPYWSRK